MKDFLTTAAEAVRLFHTTFEHPNNDAPTLIPYDRVKARAKWIKEECEELEDPAKQSLEDQIDATLDIIYFALGNFVELGVDPSPFFQIVQDANMAKVFPDGSVRKNSLGKTLKPIGWEAPEPKLAAEIDRQIARAIEIAKARTADHDAFFKPGAHAVRAGESTIEVDFELAPASALVAE